MSTQKMIKKPRLPRSFHPVTFELAYGEWVLENAHQDGGHILEADAKKRRIERCSFSKVSFAENRWAGVDVQDVVFDQCDLSNLQLHEAVMHSVHFINCKMTGIDLSGATLRHVTFEGCVAPLSSFGFINTKDVRFQRCDLTQTEFFESTFVRTSIGECLLDEANFSQVDLGAMNLSNSSFERLTVTLDKLVGCTVSSEQAIGFAKMIGLRLSDENNETN
ncbi:pentapeptide repeat-containing protein [Aureibacillus halotolerans]|uniref:Uncharacterized protein YjbI with pentapeptide repeats n=1 Tax=Aureibacillus halotolerans TaxID=1508390 RepID=A0A4R6U5M6_9BACI|nr:pentapeptide repeat-containing protein [Aureibacillus halotolerans]TDQ40852.1 uncharacterized protein YjbI with pentapeptide repeats [Aureibacillus halotolerans]